MKLRNSARTDVGRTRDHNEDDFGVGEGAQIEENGHLFVVCDGMGGHAAGEVASRLGVEKILNFYYETTGENRSQILEQAFERANLFIHAEGRGTMGTTGVAALILGDVLYVANVGDSRAYLVRGSAIHQVSRDHSLVSDQVAAGLITAEQARSLHYRNVITRALGYQPDVQVDIFRWPLEAGDMIVLSSDGLHGLIEDQEICTALRIQSLEGAVEQLVDLANERGGTDNITIVAIAIDELDWEDRSDDTDELALPDDHDPNAITQPVPVIKPPAASAPPAAIITEPDEPPQVMAQAAPAVGSIATPAPQARPERRLTLIGGALAAVVLAVLIMVILFTPRPPDQPQSPLPPTNLPQPTALAPPTPTVLR